MSSSSRETREFGDSGVGTSIGSSSYRSGLQKSPLVVRNVDLIEKLKSLLDEKSATLRKTTTDTDKSTEPGTTEKKASDSKWGGAVPQQFDVDLLLQKTIHCIRKLKKNQIPKTSKFRLLVAF